MSNYIYKNMLKILIPVFHRTFVLLLVISICQVIGSKNSKAKLNKDDLHSIQLPPCAACKVLIESFKRGMETTSRGKFEGGDSAWEENKLGSYARSEVRLIEVQEQICKDVERGKRQCQSLAEELESVFENWWFKKQDSHPDLYTYVCIEEVKNCCPKDHFGPDCQKCPGFPDKVCNNNGKCKGSGTRKGSGLCSCDKGYTGIECSECDTGYYQSYKDDNKMLCSICHSACGNSCTGPGPRNCIKCSKGWQLVEGKGCFDINECLLSDKPCKDNQFCVNEEGSYKCLECDKSCNGCNGDGPDMCIKCADGHHMKENFCINSDIHGRKKAENLSRYITYFGLVVATCIILQRNVYAASFVGLLVGLYISVSEYMIAKTGIQNSSTNLDILGPVT